MLGLMSDLTLQPITSPFDVTITPPGSKSLTNRALVLAALAEGTSHLTNVLLADDTLVMVEGLRRLGFALEVDEESCAVNVVGRGGAVPAAAAELACGNSGTTIRFLTALCGLGRGEYLLDGVERMRQRPIGQLVELLKDLGVRCEYVGAAGFPPLRVLGDGLPGGLAHYGAAQSSQFLSAVVQVCPYARNEVRISLGQPQTSWPYVGMTMQLMDEFGVTPELHRDPKSGEPVEIIIPQGVYRPTRYTVEPDASSASYFLAAAAIHAGSKVTIAGLGKRSLQGDVGFADLLHRMGADLVFGGDFITVMGSGRLEGIDADLSGMPDMAQTLAAVALFAEGPTTMRGLHTLRVKETDRVAALSNELAKLGAKVTVEGDQMTIDPPRQIAPATLDTYEDHRMAMSLAVVGTTASGITLRGVECVNKTYPGFFEDLALLQVRVA